MGWENRGEHGPYYTRTRKVEGRVVREYVGGGRVGELAAQDDRRARAARAEAANEWREECERMAALDSLVDDVSEAADILVKATLLAAGYHRHHRGEWRRRREVPK